MIIIKEIRNQISYVHYQVISVIEIIMIMVPGRKQLLNQRKLIKISE